MEGTIRKRLARGRGLLAALTALLAAVLLAAGLAAPARAGAATFPDVPEGSWYATWVDQASEKGLMIGYGEGSKQGQFGPGDALTRAQAATVLWRMADSSDPTGAAGFPDVGEGSWCAKAVAWCAEQGIVTGYEAGPNKGRFVPDGEITRQELATMSWRWAKWAKVDVTCPDPTAFESTTDWRSVDDFAAEAMTWTAAAGVLSGLDNHDGTYTLDPSGTATRAMAAKVFVVLSGKPLAPKASHTVTFESNGGSAVAPQSVTCGEAASEPDAPEKLGYTFDGWFSDEALAKAYDFAATPVTANITLYAKWEINKYTVTFDTDGGSAVVPQTVTHGDKASRPADPTKVGHTFQGWYSDEGCTQAYDFGSAVTSDLTLRAKWQINKYMVAFDAGDGSEVASQTVDCGHVASKPADPAWVGHTFQGWYSDEGLTEAYDFDAAVTSDITLYAKWEINEYTVAFDSSGGSRVASQVVTHGETALEPDDPSRFGYAFGGWFSDGDLEQAYDFGSPVVAGLTLHAKWAARPCALLYSDGLLSLQLGPVADASHGRVLARWEWDGSSRPWYAMRDRVTNVVAADAIALGRDSFETFSDLPNCEGMDLSLLDVSDVADLSYMFADCPSLAELDVSGWDVPEGTATDGAFYGCGSLGSVSLGKGCAALAEQLGGPWIDNEGTEHASITAGDLPGALLKGWSVSFDPEGAAEVASQTVAHGETAARPADPEWAGHAFAGWFCDEDCSKQYDFDSAVTSDLTLHAKWQANFYTVTFDAAGGPAVDAQAVSHGDAATRPSDPEWAGYALEGWFSDEGCTQAYDFDSAVTSDLTLHAKWAARPCAVLYADGTLSLQVGGDADASRRVLSVWDWDGSSSPWSGMAGRVASVVARDEIALSGDCSQAFSGLSGCTSMDLSKLDVSGATSLGGMFSGCSSLKALDLSGWDVSGVADLSRAFSGCSSLKALDVAGWDVSAVGDLSSAFEGCSSLESLDLSAWRPSSAESLWGMFSGCASLKSLDLSGWATPSAKVLSFMFEGCSSLESLDLSGPDASGASALGEMFSGTGSLVQVRLGEGCADVAAQLAGPWFKDGAAYAPIPAEALPGTFVRGWTVTFDTDGGTEVASQVVPNGGKAAEPGDDPEKLDRVFAGWCAGAGMAQPYDFENTPVTSDVALHAKWVEVQPYAVLYSDGMLCLQLGDDEDTETHGAVEGKWAWDRASSPWADTIFDVVKVTSVVARDWISLSGDCSEMFANLVKCESMDLKKLDVSDVTSFREMFVDDAALKALDVSGWRAFRSTDFHMTFSGCSSLESLDLSGWDVSGGEGFDQMFLNCRFLISLNLSGWNPSSTTDLSRMFINCSSLESLDLSGWDVSKATNLSSMFSGCSSLTSLDLSGWDPSSARDFQGMFFDCGSLSTVRLGAGCARIAEQLPEGPWCGEDGTAYDIIPADALPGTFTKTDPGALSLASVDGVATFDDVAAAPEAQATDRVADGSQGTIASDAEFGDVATEEPAGSDGPASDADTAQPSEAESAADSGTSADSGATEVDSDASDAGQAYTADTPDASEADVPADAGQSCGADAPADGADGSQDCATDQADSQADASADFEVVDLAGEEIQDLAA